MVGGNRHSEGVTNIQAERGEFVMRREAVDSVGVSALNALNSGIIDRDIGNTINNNKSSNVVNVSFQGNILSDDFLEDEALPKIKEMLRQGNDIGE